MWKWEAENPKAVIVMIHGAMEHHGRYGWLIEMFRGIGFHCIMGDLPGQGLAATTRGSKKGHIDSFNEYIYEVKTWIYEAYKYDLPVFVLGHSMGGLIAIRLLQEDDMKVAGMILSGPCLGLVQKPNKALNAVSHGLNFVTPQIKVDSGIRIELATRNEEVRKLDVNDSLYVTKVSVRWYRELVRSMEIAFEEATNLQDVPVLVLQGGGDLIVDKFKVKEWFNLTNFSEKWFKEFPVLYHEIFNEPEREEVFDYAKDFVFRQLKSIGYIVD